MPKTLLKYLAAAVALAAVVSFFLVPATHPLEGQPAPPIRLALLGGGTLDLAAHKDKDVVILDFWATWCSPCVQSMPVLEKVVDDYASRGVVLYTINISDDPRQIEAFLKSTGLTVRVARDHSFATARDYLVDAIPQTVIIGRDGIIKRVHVGASHNMSTELRADLDKLLPGATPAPQPSA